MLMSVTSVPQSAVDTKEITRYSICVAKMRTVKYLMPRELAA